MTIDVKNSGSLVNPVGIEFTATAEAYTFTGPSSGAIGPSTDFTVALPVGSTVVGTVTVTPSDGADTGVFAPTSVGLTTAAPSDTFIYTPVSGGAKTLSVTNNGGLDDPVDLTYTVADTGHLLNTLISYWKLDEASGARLDTVGTNHVGGASLPTAVAGKINNGCQFVAASSQFLAVADNSTLRVTSDFTFSFWAKLASTTPATGYHAISKDDNIGGTRRDYGIFHHPSAGWIFSVTDPLTIAVASGAPSSTGVWVHVVAWWDSADSKLRIRINDTTTAVSSMTGALSQSIAIFKIGAHEFTSADFFDGIIDEIGFWKRVLTAGEITALYNGGAGLPYSSFTA